MSLALNHSLSLVGELGRHRERLEHGRLRFLDLQEQRVVLVATNQEPDPSPGPDAADPDDLASGVYGPVAVEQVAAVGTRVWR